MIVRRGRLPVGVSRRRGALPGACMGGASVRGAGAPLAAYSPRLGCGAREGGRLSPAFARAQRRRAYPSAVPTLRREWPMRRDLMPAIGPIRRHNCKRSAAEQADLREPLQADEGLNHGCKKNQTTIFSW